MEEWRPIVGYECLYEVSSEGRVKALPRLCSGYRYGKRFAYMRGERILHNALNTKGYHQVKITDSNGQMHNLSVHRLVVEAFIGAIPDGMQVDHINGDRTDNTVANLRIVTPSENMRNPITSERNRIASIYKHISPVGCVQSDGSVKIFMSCSDAVRQGYATRVSGLSNVKSGRYTTHNGYKWVFYTKEEYKSLNFNTLCVS